MLWCAGWSEPLLVTHTTLLEVSGGGSNCLNLQAISLFYWSCCWIMRGWVWKGVASKQQWSWSACSFAQPDQHFYYCLGYKYKSLNSFNAICQFSSLSLQLDRLCWVYTSWNLLLDDIYYIYEPVHEISNKVVCATNKASDQPAHRCNLIRAFACRLHILWVFSYWLNNIWRF